MRQYMREGWTVTDEQHKADCLARWNDLTAECWKRYSAMKSRRMTRAELERWLKSQSDRDEASLRGMLNARK